MRLACAILLLVGARAAGVAPAETLASAVPAEKKNPIDAVEATYGRVRQRWRDYLNLPLNCEPKHFPVADASAAAMVIAIREENPEAALHFAGSCLEGVWANELDISDTSILLRLAEGLDIDGEAALSKKESMLSVRESESKLAISNGVYGAPTYVVNGEIFWGQDRLDFLERFVAD